MKDRTRKRRRSRSEDLDTPRRHISNALVPVSSTRHAAEESSDTSEVDDEGPEDDKLEVQVPNGRVDGAQRDGRQWKVHPGRGQQG